MYYFLISLILSAPCAFGLSFFSEDETPEYKVPTYTPPTPKPQPMPCLTNNQMIEKNIFYCPRIDKLRKQGLKWVAGKPWKAYSESFVERIDRFSGAQWSGPAGSVGRLLCFYEGVEKNNFPVKITTTTLIRRPDLPIWEEAKNSKGTIYNCVSTRGEVCDCPFKIATNVNNDSNETKLEKMAKTDKSLDNSFENARQAATSTSHS
jgi:hypothetical protein